MLPAECEIRFKALLDGMPGRSIFFSTYYNLKIISKARISIKIKKERKRNNRKLHFEVDNSLNFIPEH